LPLSKGIDLQRRLHRQLLDNLDLKKMGLGSQSEAQVRQQTEEVLRGLVSDIGPEERQGLSMAKLMDDVINQALGLGPLEDLLKDEEVTEIMVNGHEKVYVERGGRLERAPVQFLDDAQVVEVIRRIVAPIGRRIDESQPMVDGRLSDGSRVNAIIAPLAISGPSITIRKFSQDPFSVQDLIGFGSLTANMASFLGICVRHRKNICISGGTGSGKTTLLGVVASSIPEGERIVTIEDAAELRLPQDHLVSLESKPPNLEGEGAIPIRKLVINALRMRPDRIIVGECRGAEALDMLQAMNTGHDGSLTTLHANTCRDAISRMETMVLMAGTNLPAKAIVQQIAAAVDVIVQTNRFPDGSRRITSISVVDGIEGDKVTLQEVFAFEMKGYDRDGKVLGHYLADGGIPAFYLELKERGIDVDMGIFR
jgi:pilus assembly protein CpaF